MNLNPFTPAFIGAFLVYPLHASAHRVMLVSVVLEGHYWADQWITGPESPMHRHWSSCGWLVLLTLTEKKRGSSQASCFLWGRMDGGLVLREWLIHKVAPPCASLNNNCQLTHALVCLLKGDVEDRYFSVSEWVLELAAEGVGERTQTVWGSCAICYGGHLKQTDLQPKP